ncbi:hypothetical protein VB780_28175 [Leptolyngbya sp. CCNP1308]|uniref:hypothetical protein n=1 Tax=Leptolyngbya sp. CCNP1308 TaxID=3110255 RepID=UPI002B214E9A|nr:hypothetical protein [Leptolyngbya sp. CCNP1308]MEA5452483.1 hypothetical protein [Leptolyngbya sp. CCNP1308]
MQASRWMALPLLFGLSTLAIACDAPQETEVDEQLETDPTGAESLENEEEGTEGVEGAEGDD